MNRSQAPVPWSEGDLEVQRERVTEILGDAFTHDLLGLEDYEKRLDLAGQAVGTRQLQELLADLPESVTGPATYAQGLTQTEQRVTAALSQRTLHGNWLRSRWVSARSVMAQTVLDFREVSMPREPVQLELMAVMTEVVIRVPPGLAVEFDVNTIMAEASVGRGVSGVATPGQPCLRISGTAIMSEVRVVAR